MMAPTRTERHQLRSIFTRLLSEEHAKRPERSGTSDGYPEWLGLERNALLKEVNAQRAMVGSGPILMKKFILIEETCAGHVDYAAKLVLRCSELVFDHP